MCLTNFLPGFCWLAYIWIENRKPFKMNPFTKNWLVISWAEEIPNNWQCFLHVKFVLGSLHIVQRSECSMVGFQVHPETLLSLKFPQLQIKYYPHVCLLSELKSQLKSHNFKVGIGSSHSHLLHPAQITHRALNSSSSVLPRYHLVRVLNTVSPSSVLGSPLHMSTQNRASHNSDD